MKRSVGVVIFFFFAACAMAQDIGLAVAKAKERNVYVRACVAHREASRLWLKKRELCWNGSGVIVENGRVLSSYHLIVNRDKHDRIKEEMTDLSVWGRPAKLLKAGPEKDLILLEIDPGPMSLPRLTIASIVPGKPIIIVANRILGGEQSFTNKVAFGTTSSLGSCMDFRIWLRCSMLVTDAFFIQGFSGGGFWNMEGQLVGIGMGYIEYGEHSVAVSGEDVEEFLKDVPARGSVQTSAR